MKDLSIITDWMQEQKNFEKVTVIGLSAAEITFLNNYATVITTPWGSVYKFAESWNRVFETKPIPS
jgi:hypothetical protein